ncbi:MAG: ATP-binding cassette domain-containing protein [Bacteroidota bacterium]
MITVDIVLPRRQFDLNIREVFGPGITGIFGPSGAGKTSLLHALAGIARPTSGLIQVGDHLLFHAERRINLPMEKRNIGYVFQEGRLFPHLNAQQNLRYGYYRSDNPPLAFEEVVTLLRLAPLLDRKPDQISGGERQRIALGRSLLSSPELLLLDEPFSAVDQSLRQQIIPFLLDIQQRTHIPMLVVSHQLTDLLQLTQQLCLLKAGNSVAHGTYRALVQQDAARAMLSPGPDHNFLDP